MTANNDKEAKFLDLVQRVTACTKCPRMAGSARVLGPGCGPLNAPLMFIGEAPGRLGADGSHLPFHGDKSGHNFERLIEQVGISRYEVFVTNAVLCNPKDERGNNATPSPAEIANCAPFLRETIEILDPSIVVTLGAVALKACSMLEAHSVSLRDQVRTNSPWMRRSLIPVYHPGQRAMVHRSFANQLSDYQFVAETLRRLKRPRKRTVSAKPRPDAAKLGHVARQVLQSNPAGLSYFALHKLCFLAEVASLEATGERLTNAYVVRQKDGPYFVDLHLAKLPQLIAGIQVRSVGSKVMLGLPPQLSLLDAEPAEALSASDDAAIKKVLTKYGRMRDDELKRVVYLSKYMRALLRKERSTGANLYNAAVLPFATRE
ncbi:uracil-DNA glycosylase [Ralstonia pseudosolanacearum]|uniref:uracil-DNA glycosylase n=1 Tax=Ralstonia pseudosolanacearum TaxID=1310165 RepID=UPI00267685B2|nr:uracil-DNA glycosylase [Ralstonia pseudosolanacearum]MDO3524739.1 uracil-DNA glycosylase [Ralstonia pseudosolanacearum]MDO3549686.1 uracil-DNA glycosylase [Ralstonia pseudosolanacearum]MDO3554428.1 uracil-DNA glycosylase [Ralstonia pseudosolanacearum]MDO3569148.1 uracil-DNA glycosylase [Ralstonia pseudosolanacearum]MDO3584081.1 uracil-DNA glycosylase [Ralstonia pseudosolanacearum]